jgi:hypothetical protein
MGIPDSAMYWPGTVSVDGQLQAARESLEEQRARADRAEARLKRIRNLVRPGRHYVIVGGVRESITVAVRLIIDEET